MRSDTKENLKYDIACRLVLLYFVIIEYLDQGLEYRKNYWLRAIARMATELTETDWSKQ